MTRFRVLTWGAEDLPAVVCLHGASGHARRFERLARMLEDSRRVVAYDLRGHGRSPWSGPQTLDQHVADLDEVMSAAGVDEAALVGHSLGARIAMHAACRQPDRVTALVLLDPPLHTPPVVLRRYAADERTAEPYETLDAAISRTLADGGLWHTPRALIEEDMAEHLVAGDDGWFRPRHSRDAAAAAMEALADEEPPPLEDISCPTLLVRAEHSQLISEDHAAQAAEEFRTCSVHAVPGGHMVLWDALAETGALVRHFLVAGTRV
ncbi:MAG: alpha/beta fold hydrolase [Gaiellales bacterium]